MGKVRQGSAGDGRRGRPRDRQADGAILAATRELLEEVGFEQLTVTDVAARAGVGRPTVYRRYPSKEALIAASVEALRSDLPAPDTGSLCGDIREELLSRASTLGEPLVLQFLAMLLVSNANRSEFAETYWREAVAQRRHAFAEVFERAKARGEISEQLDVDLAIDVVAGPVIYQLLRPNSVRDEPLEKRVERLIDLLCSMLEGLDAD